jgi:hypothetical protein
MTPSTTTLAAAPAALTTWQLDLRLIRFGGHLPKGGYDVPDAKQIQWSASPPAVL